MTALYFAAIADDGWGPALGIGTTKEAAMVEPLEYTGGDATGIRVIQITERSYNAIRAGNPDAVNELVK